jgi:anti-anti-sigma factor
MRFKIDTREKFHAITIQEPALAANMTAELSNYLLNKHQNGCKNVVLNLQDIQTVDNAAAESLVKLQQEYYEKNASFVICCLNKEVEDFLDKEGLLEMMNVTATETEAGDIVLLEEVERELLGD